MLNLAIVSVSRGTHGSFPRFSPDAVGEMWADAVINDAGYATRTDLVLSRYEHVERFFPNADELRERGVDVMKLAACLQEGLIVVEHFNDTINSLSVDELNGALEHLLEGSEAYRAHPDDALDRSMHLQGCCGCCRHAG